MSFASPSKPALALRIGVTGARALDPNALPHLRDEARHWLGRLKAEMERLAALPEVKAAYVPGTAAPLLRFTSALAEGSDRLVARAALDAGWPLYTVLPFPQADYERDFTKQPGSVEEFRGLLAEVVDGGILELDGGRGDLETQSYGAAGRTMVAHADLVIAIWNGKPSEHRGGTWDTIRFAIRQGVPVLWIDAAGHGPSRWISTRRELLRPLTASTGVETELCRLLDHLVVPPKPWHRHAHGWFDRLVFLGAPAHVEPERDYWNETALPASRFAQSHSRFMALFAAGWRRKLPAAAATPPAAPSAPTVLSSYWQDRLEAPDQLSVDYARRYRSTYVWVFLLAALALLFGATALVPAVIHAAAPEAHHAADAHGAPAGCLFSAHTIASLFALLEAICLAAILCLVVKVKRRAWHEKSIEYRLLAELYRKQSMLAPLGWTLPVTDVDTVAGAKARGQERSSWVAWQFAADVRAAPFPSGSIDVAREKSEVAATVAGQVRYHAGRACQSEAAASRLEGFGAAAFFLVLAGVAAKLGLGLAGASALAVFAGWSAVVLPAFSAAFVGIRAYAELELLASQSHHMAIELEAAQGHIASVDPAAALASADLGSETLAVTEMMLQDLEGWARLFRLKVAEVG